MNVRFMQSVDYWVGIPLCAIVSLWNRLLCSLFGESAKTPPQKVLCIELSEMGSTVIAYPSMKRITEELQGNENLYFLIFESNRESIDLLNIIPAQNILTIKDKNFLAFVFSTLFTLVRIRSLGIDTCLDLELYSRFTALLSYLSGARRRVGFHNFTEEGLYRGSFITHPVWYNPFLHMSQNYLALQKTGFGESKEYPHLKETPSALPSDQIPKYRFSEEEQAPVRERLTTAMPSFIPGKSRLLLINPDPGQLPLRGWPLEHYEALLRTLVETDKDLFIAVCGVAGAESFAERFKQCVPSERFCNLVGKTNNLKHLLQFFAESACLLTSDSGPAHFAGLTETPVVVLFGPESPTRYRPLGKNVSVLYSGLHCSPCFSAGNHRHSCCRNNVCLQQITPQQVMQKIEGSFQ